MEGLELTCKLIRRVLGKKTTSMTRIYHCMHIVTYLLLSLKAVCAFVFRIVCMCYELNDSTCQAARSPWLHSETKHFELWAVGRILLRQGIDYLT